MTEPESPPVVQDEEQHGNDNKTGHPAPENMTYEEAVDGNEIYNFHGGRVVEYTTTAGRVLAIKQRGTRGLDRSEGAMMDHAARNGVLAPRVLGVYDIVTTSRRRPLARVMVSDRVPGESLKDVWHDLSAAQQASVKEQLRAQLACMREITQPFIGRVGHLSARNNYERIATRHDCGPFENEAAFDDWCLQRIQHRSSISRWKWKRLLDRERLASSGRFVLTHGDLTPRNIMVKDGLVTGIVDWDRSGFYPEYAEYAFAMALGHGIEEWWLPVLKEVLQPCSKQRVQFTRLIEYRGW